MSDLIRKILVPTDFSEAADVAVNTAANFARKLNAKLILLHVVDIPEYGSFYLKDDLQRTSLEEIAYNTAQTRLNSSNYPLTLRLALLLSRSWILNSNNIKLL